MTMQSITAIRPTHQTLTTERWLPVPGFEGRYEVSDHGRIRSIRNRHVKTPRVSPQGYHFVMLWIYSQEETCYKRFYIHRLVAMAFIANYETKPMVNHKDRNRQNNHILNLEWVTNSENVRHWQRDEREKASTPACEDEQIKEEDLPF